MDLVSAEMQLNTLIERRASRGGQDPDEREELWKASVRRHYDRLRQERLFERLAFHRMMLESHTRNFEELMRRHRVGLRLCEEALGITRDEGDSAA